MYERYSESNGSSLASKLILECDVGGILQRVEDKLATGRLDYPSDPPLIALHTAVSISLSLSFLLILFMYCVPCVMAAEPLESQLQMAQEQVQR